MIVELADGQRIACAPPTPATGRTPLLCVPGGPARAAVYLGDLGGLDRIHPLHLLDQRGSGGSQPADPATLTVDRLARDLVEVTPLLGLHRPAILAHSFGARVLLSALALDPALAGAVVLVTPATTITDAFAAGREAILAERAPDPTYADAVEAARALPEARPRDRGFLEQETVKLWYGRWDAAAQHHAAAQREQVAIRTAMSLRNDTAAWSAPDLSALDVPVLVVAGSLDFLLPPVCAHAAHEALPGSTYAEIDGAGHFPWLDEPEAFRDIVGDFLAGEGLT